MTDSYPIDKEAEDAERKARRDQAIDDHANAIKDACLMRLLKNEELWDKHVRDYGACMTPTEYRALERAARFACQGDFNRAGAFTKLAWKRSLEQAAEEMALAEAEERFARRD